MPLTHMRKGDILFTADSTGTPMHFVISTAQRIGSPFGRGHASSVHAAIATGVGFEVYESVGSGVRSAHIHHGSYRLYAYRGPQKDAVREAAVLAAESFVQMASGGNFGAYNKLDAALSPFRSLRGATNQPGLSSQQFGTGARAQNTLYCSNMVWRAYAAAGEMVGLNQLPIPFSRPEISPRDLEGLLISSPNWHARNNGHSMTHP